MTVSRPGELPAALDLLEPPSRRRIPWWAKVGAVVVAVMVVAATNVAAGRREHARQRAAADRVDVTMLTTTGAVHDHAFEVTLVVLNRGTSTITVKAGRVEPALYDARPFEDDLVATGATERLVVPFTVHCPGPTQGPAQSVQLVVPIAPASGRVRDVRTPLEPAMMWDLSRRACGYVRADEAAEPSSRAVSSSHYGVQFVMHVLNRADQPFTLVNLTSPGLAISVRGGVPLVVGHNTTVDLDVSVALPACTPLPPFGQRARGGGQRFGMISLQLRDETGADHTKLYPPEPDLASALIALRGRICPASLQLPSGTRPRAG